MIPDCVVGELRATIFASPIIYDPSNLQRISSVLKTENGYMPSIVPPPLNGIPFPVPIGMNQGIPLDWEMASQKTNLRVHFTPQKIDVLKSSHHPSATLEEDFCVAAVSIFKGIIEKFQLIPTRLAYAPIYTPEFDKNFKRADFLKKIYSVNQFEGKTINTILFKQGYILTERIGEKDYNINYVADASEGQSLEERTNSDGTKGLYMHSMLNLVLDINTRQGEGYTFTVPELESFFSNCIEKAHKFRDFYVSFGQ